MKSKASLLRRRPRNIRLFVLLQCYGRCQVAPHWPKLTSQARPPETRKLQKWDRKYYKKYLFSLFFVYRTAPWAKAYNSCTCTRAFCLSDIRYWSRQVTRSCAFFFSFFLLSVLPTCEVRKRHRPPQILVLSRRTGRSHKIVRTGKKGNVQLKNDPPTISHRICRSQRVCQIQWINHHW